MGKKHKRNKKGFLLIQTLLVIAIMTILSTAIFITVAPQINKAKDAKIKDEVIQIRNALTQYYDDTGCFPASLPTCGEDFQANGIIYYKSFPCNPYGIPYAYQTESSTCPKWYKVLTNLENSEDPSIIAVGCAGGCGPKCDYNYGVSSSNIALNQGCPQPPENYYACTPSGQCTTFANPGQSRCPITFLNDPTCQNKCSDKTFRCHDDSGKTN